MRKGYVKGVAPNCLEGTGSQGGGLQEVEARGPSKSMPAWLTDHFHPLWELMTTLLLPWDPGHTRWCT